VSNGVHILPNLYFTILHTSLTFRFTYKGKAVPVLN